MLGKPLRTFRPNLVPSGLALAAISAGSGLLWWVSRKVEGAPPAIVGLAVLASVLSVVLMIAFHRETTLRVVAHEDGIAWSRAGRSHEVAFAEIKRIHEMTSSVLIFRKAGGEPLTLPTTVIDRPALLAHLNLVAPELPKAKIHTR